MLQALEDMLSMVDRTCELSTRLLASMERGERWPASAIAEQRAQLERAERQPSAVA